MHWLHPLSILVGLIFICAAPPILAGQVYKWVDTNGRTHFSDKVPVDQKAETIKIQSFSGPAEVATVAVPASEEVKLYTTTWCGVCRRAKSYLARLAIAYTEYDVEKDSVGRDEYRRLRGRGVPIILVGNKRMDGFDAQRLEQMLEQAGLLVR